MILSLQIDSWAADVPVLLGGRNYLFQFRWNYRSSDWRASVQDEATSEWLCVSRRVSPGGSLLQIPDVGELRAFGADPYALEDLGGALRLEWLPFEEVTREDAFGLDPIPVLVPEPEGL